MAISRTWLQIAKIIHMLCIVAILLTSVTCNAADLVVRQTGQSEWKKVLEFGPVGLMPPVWCGNTTLVTKEWEWDREIKKSGIVYVDVVNNKTKWISKDPLIKDPSCNYDGSIIFMYKMRYDPKLEEGYAPDGLRAYDLNTDKSKKIGNVSTDYLTSPASPAGRTFALVAGEKKYLRFKSINLPGWSILAFPRSDLLATSGAQWATDGSYFLLRLQEEKNRKETLEFYDANGALIRTVQANDFQLSSTGSHAMMAKKEGVYWLASNGHLKKFDVKTGQIQQLSFHAMIAKNKLFTFDISPTQEIAYNKNDQNNELWIASLVDSKAQNIGEIGLYPRFSKTGEYMAFIRMDKNGTGTLSIMQRVIK